MKDHQQIANISGICSGRIDVECNQVLTGVKEDPLCLSKPIPVCLTVSGCTQAQGVHARPLFFLHN